MLYKMFDIEPPLYAHLPLITDLKGKKLSKRFGDISVQSFRERGYLPEALLNSVALLGWSPPVHHDPRMAEKTLKEFEK